MAVSYRSQTDHMYLEKAKNEVENMPDFMRSYLNDHAVKTEEKSRSVYAYIMDIKHFMEYVADGRRIAIKDVSTDVMASVTTDEIMSYLGYTMSYDDDNGIKRTNSLTSRKRKFASIRSLYKYLCLEKKIIKDNPTIGIQLDKPSEKEIIYLRVNEIKNLMNVVRTGTGLSNHQQDYHNKISERDTLILSILIATGIRVSELVGLNIGSYNKADNSLQVIRKGNKSGTVYINDDVAALLDEYIAKRKNVIPDNIYKNDTAALFLSSHKTKISADGRKIHTIPLEERKKVEFVKEVYCRMSVAGVEELVKRYAKIIDPTLGERNGKITPHRLRASFAMALLNGQFVDIDTGEAMAPVSVEVVQRALGHKSITTVQRYADASEERVKKASRFKF